MTNDEILTAMLDRDWHVLLYRSSGVKEKERFTCRIRLGSESGAKYYDAQSPGRALGAMIDAIRPSVERATSTKLEENNAPDGPQKGRGGLA